MIGKQKQRVSDAIYRSFKAVFSGGFYHQKTAQKHGLNEKATAWLYNEALFHLSYIIVIYYGNIFRKKYKWATTELFMAAANKACAEEGYDGAFVQLLFQQLDIMESMSGIERSQGAHFQRSASYVAAYDPTADEERIAKELESAAMEFFDELQPKLQALANRSDG